jgi:probable HAF family extracellular repeat protein
MKRSPSHAPSTFRPSIATCRFSVVVLLVAMVLADRAPRVRAAPTPLYAVTDLGTLGGSNSQATGINATGEVTGVSFTAGGSAVHGFLWNGTTMIDIGTLGGSTSLGLGINAAGQVTGTSYVPGNNGPFPPSTGPTHAFLWNGATMQDLGTLPGGSASNGSVGHGINDAGEVTGDSFTTTFGPPDHAFLWNGTTLQDLGTLGGRDSIGFAINNAGEVTGDADTPISIMGQPIYHAFLWNGTTMQDLGTLPAGAGAISVGIGINAAGDVTGVSDTTADQHAFLWNGTTMQDLGTLGGPTSEGESVNSADEVVGSSGTAGGQGHAFLYDSGVMYDLNTLLVSPTPWTIYDANGINDAGQISATGIDSGGVTHALLLSPVQPTSTTVLATSGDYDDVVALQATVAPAGVAGSVQFLVNGSSVGTASYNSAAGLATLPYLIPLPAGTYSIEADFTSSNPRYLSSTGSRPTGLTVTLEQTTLSYTGDTVIANGGTATMSGVLLEDNVKPIGGRTVLFTLGTGASQQTCSGVTNPGGIATCAITPVAQPLGPGVVADAFAGDAFYRPASASATTTMFAFLTTGSDVVGDQSASIGAGVTFWGAQWSSLNNLSGGAAPASFKGFASTLATEPPTCRISWTTGPGASSDPPAAVPSYMGVVVSTTVGKSGPTISGDVLSIVVVQTNAGYAPDPGHPGTGTVVAQFCHR